MIQHIIYLTSLFVSFLLSIFCAKSHPSLKLIPYILGLAVLTEGFVNISYYLFHELGFNLIYHFYIPIEYCIISFFFYLNINNQRIKKFIIGSIPLFIIFSFIISWKIVELSEFPGHIYNAEGFLLCTWAVITLFSIEIDERFSLYQLPIFWICVGILIFHSGIFVMNGLFNKLHVENKEIFNKLRLIIEKTTNILLYLFYSLSLLCSNRITKSYSR